MPKNVGKNIHGIVLQPRAIIRPKVDVKVGTDKQKQEVLKSARQVISTHRAVLEALRDR